MAQGGSRVHLFTGHRDHKLDGKDRIVVPSAYAAAIEASGEAALFLVPGAEGRYLEAYPADVFRTMASETTRIPSPAFQMTLPSTRFVPAPPP